jgi:hypothetical protein
MRLRESWLNRRIPLAAFRVLKQHGIGASERRGIATWLSPRLADVRWWVDANAQTKVRDQRAEALKILSLVRSLQQGLSEPLPPTVQGLAAYHAFKGGRDFDVQLKALRVSIARLAVDISAALREMPQPRAGAPRRGLEHRLAADLSGELAKIESVHKVAVADQVAADVLGACGIFAVDVKRARERAQKSPRKRTD